MELFPHNSNFNFMRARWVSLAIAAILFFVALGGLVFKDMNFALDFTGGTVTELSFSKPVKVEDVRKRLESNGFHGAEVRTYGSSSEVVVRLPLREAGKTQAGGVEIQRGATTPDNAATLVRSDFVGPQIGKELAINGIYAAMFVVLGFLGYVWIRFEWKFAVAAIITTLHDTVLVAGWFALSGHEFDLAVLAGILSVMGYSINDTIVVFDRVRENFRTVHKAGPEEILNRSVNQTLSRTIITSFVALLTVLALYYSGAASLKGMAESQIIGIIIGTLSSIFVACPLLLWLGVTKQDLLPRAKEDAELARRP